MNKTKVKKIKQSDALKKLITKGIQVDNLGNKYVEFEFPCSKGITGDWLLFCSMELEAMFPGFHNYFNIFGQTYLDESRKMGIVKYNKL